MAYPDKYLVLNTMGHEKNLNSSLSCGEAALTFCLPGALLLVLVNNFIRG